MTEFLWQLVQDSQSGSCFYRSKVLTERPLTADEVQAASAYVRQHAGVSSYHLLMALREQAPEVYATIPDVTKGRILCDALEKVASLNDFGILRPSGSHDGVAAWAIVEVGDAAISCLRALLDDRREGALFGSREAATSKMYQYRRADFAYRYLMLIIGREPTFAANPEDRDDLIDELKREMAGEVAPRT